MFIVTGVISAGACVGDEDDTLILGRRRKESIFIKDYVGALVISREDYLDIFHQKHHLADIQKFLSKQPWCMHWPVDKLKSKHVIVKYYRSGILISDGTEIPRYIHVLKGGQAQVIRQIQDNMFVVAKELAIGDSYGIHDRFGNISNRKTGLYLVSHGCEIVSIRASHFNEFDNLKGTFSSMIFDLPCYDVLY